MAAVLKEQKLTDSDLQQKVMEELTWDTRVRHTEVGVEAGRGVVTLTGTVGSYAEKMAALDAACRVAGVVDVANDIEVRSGGEETVTDTEIAHAVRHALEWDTFVPSRLLRSAVTNGWVTLEGTVPVFRQRLDAERAIQHLAGVKGVINNVVVAPDEASPQEIRKTILQVLERQAEREARHIDVTVKNGIVTLAGRVRAQAERRAVLEAVEHAPGVAELEDLLVVDPAA